MSNALICKLEVRVFGVSIRCSEALACHLTYMYICVYISLPIYVYIPVLNLFSFSHVRRSRPAIEFCTSSCIPLCYESILVELSSPFILTQSVHRSWVIAPKMSGSGGYYKYRCKYWLTYNCPNWVWVNNAPCAHCLVSF